MRRLLFAIAALCLALLALSSPIDLGDIGDALSPKPPPGFRELASPFHSF